MLGRLQRLIYCVKGVNGVGLQDRMIDILRRCQALQETVVFVS